jgi:cation:H+ antiporter
MVVGLTIVGFGTSAPELIVNTLSASKGVTALAFGNVVGSNISNLALVLGTAALVMPITIQGQLVKREVPLLLLATAVVTAMAADSLFEGGSATISRSEAVVLLLLFCIFVYTNVLEIYQRSTTDQFFLDVDDSPLVIAPTPSRARWLFVIAGCALLFIGGDLAVEGAVDLAAYVDVHPVLIGLFVVAVGTSMPELATSIIAALRHESDLALGNVVGSNLFNTLVVMPVTALVGPVKVPAGGITDLMLSLSLTVALIPLFFYGEARLGRRAGGFLLLVYAGYAVARISTAEN